MCYFDSVGVLLFSLSVLFSSLSVLFSSLSVLFFSLLILIFSLSVLLLSTIIILVMTFRINWFCFVNLIKIRRKIKASTSILCYKFAFLDDGRQVERRNGT